MSHLAVKILLGSVVFAVASLEETVTLWAQGANSQGTTVAQAIKRSRRTGQPIFAVAGASYCPACRKLLNTLNTDESLQPFIEQFVPLKINAQSSDYARWKQFFPPKRAAIPALFIVTPQGQELYSRVGALPSENLRKVLLTSLEKAGRYPTREQWQEISKSLKSAERAFAESRLEQGLELLKPILAGLEEMGTLAELSEAGQQTVALVEQLASTQRAAFDEALQTFVAKASLENAIQVAVLESLMSAFPQQRKQVKIAIKKNVRAADQRKLLRQARELQRAEVLASQPKSRRKAVAALKRITKRYPNSDVAARAEQKLQTLNEAEPVTSSSVGAKYSTTKE